MTDDERTLIDGAKNGDQAAFAELVRRTYADTYTLAYRLTGNEQDACDVVQDAYLRAMRGMKRFRGEAQFSTWMYRITANCAASHLGGKGRRSHEELTEELGLADERPGLDPQDRAEGAALRRELQDAISALPAKLRAVVVLRDVYDLSHGEIAEELGISTSAAKVRLHRARRKLRERLYPLPDEEAARAV